MTQRYIITTLPSENVNANYIKWVILDREWCGFCTIKDENDNLLPLEWSSRSAAESWMNTCYKRWDSGRAPAPDNWRPFKKVPSPWA